MPNATMVIGQYYYTLLQDKVRPAVCHKQPGLLEHDVILLQDKATPHHHWDVQNLVQHWGWDVLAFLPTLHVIIGCLHV
jgi:hypothetical protein